MGIVKSTEILKMALVVEDGTGLNNSNGYISVAEYKAYADERGIDYASFSDSEIEQSIVVASSDFLEAYYNFKGDILQEDQALKLPTDIVEINAKVKKSTCIATNLNLDGLLMIVTTADTQKGDIKRLKEKVDVVESEVEYREGSQQTAKVSTPVIDRLLSPYLANGYGGITGLDRW